jgi:hypothetical protein
MEIASTRDRSGTAAGTGPGVGAVDRNVQPAYSIGVTS